MTLFVIMAITAFRPPEEAFMYTGQALDNSDIKDRQVSQTVAPSSGLLISASPRVPSVDPIHPSLSDLTQVQGQPLHFHRELKLPAAQDEKQVEVEVFNFKTKKIAFVI